MYYYHYYLKKKRERETFLYIPFADMKNTQVMVVLWLYIIPLNGNSNLKDTLYI